MKIDQLHALYRGIGMQLFDTTAMRVHQLLDQVFALHESAVFQRTSY